MDVAYALHADARLSVERRVAQRCCLQFDIECSLWHTFLGLTVAKDKKDDLSDS